MNGFRIWALHDLSYILHTKSLQHETHVSTNTFKHYLSNFLNFSRKQKNARDSGRINLPTLSNDLESIFTTWMALPEITMTTFSSRSSAYFLPLSSKANTEITHPETFKPLIKYEELLDGNPVYKNKSYKMLSNIQSGDFNFIYNTMIKSDDIHYDNYTSKIMFTHQESQKPEINHTIGQELTDDLSVCIAGKNLNSPFSTKSKLKTSEIKQQELRNWLKLQDNQYSRNYDSSQSPEFRNDTQKNLFSSTMKQRIQFSQTSRCVLQTPTNTSKPSLFETLKKSNTIMKTQECPKEIPRNISSKWSSMEWSYPRREYYTRKTCKIENMIKYDDRFFVSDMHATRQEQSAGYRSSRFGHLTYSGSSGNQGSRKSRLSFVPCRVFSSKSCTMIQQSVREFENLRKNLSANTLVVRLKSTRSHLDRVSLMKLQSFSHDALKSKKTFDCEKDDKSQRSKCEVETKKDYSACSQEVVTSRCRIESKKICGKMRQKDTCVSSQDDANQKQRERKSKLSKNYMCSELNQRKPCTWDKERCPDETRRKERVSSRDRQLRDPNCSQKQDVDRRCNKKQQSYKRREDCKKVEPAICKNSIKRKNDCESKYEKQYVKSDMNEKERRKCIGNSRKRSNSCHKRHSSRASDKSSSKINGERCYSQQSIFPFPQDRKSFSTLISDIALGMNVRRFYATCSNEKDRRQGPSCGKRKIKCGTKKEDEIKKKCVKGPAKCMSRKKTTDKMQTCQYTRREKDKELYESTKKSHYEEFCKNKKKEESVKDKKPAEQSIKEQIDREYKEIDECKKGVKKEKKDDKAKMVSTEHKLNHIISLCKEQKKKDSEKFANTRNESIISTDAIFKWFNIQSKIINGKIPIIAKNVRLFNTMFDRSFSTTKLNYQNDFAIKRTMNDDKIVQNCSTNSDDFIHDDELPNYVEIEYEDEEDDVYDWATSRSISEIN